MEGEGKGGLGEITKVPEGNGWGSGDVHCTDGRDGFVDTHVCEN